MDVAVVIWKQMGEDDDWKLWLTFTVAGTDIDTVFTTAISKLLDILEPFVKTDEDYKDLRFETDLITRWRFEERFKARIEPIVPRPVWEQFSWDILPTTIIEAKRGYVE